MTALAFARSSRSLVLACVIALTLPLAGCGVNNIPTYEQNAKAAWSEVLNAYKSRADLIPNLVDTVKGYANFERSALEAVIAARSKVIAAPDTPAAKPPPGER